MNADILPQKIARLSKSKWIPTRKCMVLAIPYLWMSVFFMIPFVIVFQISLTEAQISIPPYSSLFTFVDEQVKMLLHVSNYSLLFEDDFYLNAYLRSIKVATISTFLCFLVGFPIAWAIVHSKPSTRNVLLMLILLPSWTSFLIRVYAWIGILNSNGLLNNFLMTLGIIDEPLRLLYTDTAVYIGIVYTYLPFMILPLYTALMRVDYSLIEAAQDLGAKPVTILFSVLLPLIKSGIIAGSMLVFIPAIGEFVIPNLLGGPENVLIGGVLWQEFFMNRDWPVAAAIASVMLLILIGPIMIYYRYQKKDMGAA
ncbi:ABC transporter permease subunit [Vibrio sp.]|uniref:ABC transporter permease subunit n=1 Tax=Vibrio sp. TaxID=678 RepID=UPI003D10B330